MILLGGFADAIQDTANVARHEIEGTGPLAMLLRVFDHIWHELEGGDIKTWIAFVAAALFLLKVLEIVARVIINKRKGT